MNLLAKRAGTTSRRRLATVAAVPLVAGTLMMMLPGQASAATQSKCNVSAKLNWGTAEATSTCTPIAGPMVQGTKQVNNHRAVIKCANIRGQGNQHDIYVTLHGPWKRPGEASTVSCPMRSSLAGYSQDTN
ncbi:hypothetical protein ABT095_08455 [Kitasatospora sp. NPDC002227]|uniref:hypothetical protein n=1 Tax=Kitasatospora sp. NPDC002227 TaxID=3154773 RepID=UPI003326A4C4